MPPPDFSASTYWQPRLYRELQSGGFEWLITSQLAIPFILSSLPSTVIDANKNETVVDLAAIGNVTAGINSDVHTTQENEVITHKASLYGSRTRTSDIGSIGDSNIQTSATLDSPNPIESEIGKSHNLSSCPYIKDEPSRNHTSRSRSLRILHLGCGSSSLGHDLALSLAQCGYENVEIVDADYIDLDVVNTVGPVEDVNGVNGEEGVDGMDRVKLEDALGSRIMVKRRVMDVLSTSSVLSKSTEEPFDLIIDKSTADAISCGPDVNFDLHAYTHAHSSAHFHVQSNANSAQIYANDQINDQLDRVDPKYSATHPLEVTLLNLALITRRGSRWSCISYSSSRFDWIPKLSTTTTTNNNSSHATLSIENSTKAEKYWALVSRTLLLQTSGQGQSISSSGRSGSLGGSGSPGGSGKGEEEKSKIKYEPETGVWGWVLERI